MTTRKTNIISEEYILKLEQENEELRNKVNRLSFETSTNSSKLSYDDFLLLLSKSSDSITIWDNDLNLLEINQATLELFALSQTREELIGKHIKEVFPYISATPRIQIYGRVARTGHPISLNFYQYLPQIKEGRYFSSEAFKVGQSLGIVVKHITRNITQQERLLEAEMQLTRTQKVAKIGYWSLNLITDDIFWSDETFEILGYHPIETKPTLELFLNRIIPEDRAKVQQDLLDPDSRNFQFQRLFRIQLDEKIYYLRYKGETKKNNEGRIIQKDGIIQDVSEQIINQRNLIRSEERFRLIADNISEVFWLRTPDKILYINKAFERIWKISRTEIYKNHKLFFEKVHPEDLEKIRNLINFNNSDKGGNRSITEFRIIRADQSERWIWAKTFRVHDKQGKPRIIGFASDITMIKKHEQELIEAKIKAEESDRLKSAFLANMSHELRTPLNAVIGFSDLLSNSNSMKDIYEYGSIINRAGLQLLDIINNIFSAALLETQQISFKEKAFLLEEIIPEISQSVQSEAENAGKENLEINFVPDINSNNPSLFTDPKYIKQIWLILLNNALKFTEKGFINYGYKVLDNRQIKFYVKDSGIGIPPEKQEVIFNKFIQLEETPTRRFGGTGLGLSIVRKIVELMKGYAGVDSQLGKGSEFYFTLPCLNQTIAPTASLIFNTKVDWSHKKILIVEDDKESFRLLSSYLKETNIHIFNAFQGEGVLDIFRKEPNIDIVLMDLNLPQMNGFETTRLLKEKYPLLTVIAQTAYVSPETVAEIYNSGCNDYLEKPISRDELLHTLNHYL